MFDRFLSLFRKRRPEPPTSLSSDGLERRRGSSALSYLLESLEEIGEGHPELYDTDVRERLWDLVDHRIMQGDSNYPVPSDFGMFSEAANRKLHEALSRDL